MAEPSDSDLGRAVTRLWASAVEGLYLRLELFGLELGAERQRITDLMLSALVVAFAIFMLVLSLNVALLVLVWDTHRVPVAIGLCVFYAALALGAAAYHFRRSRRASPPFAATTQVLADDERALRDLV